MQSEPRSRVVAWYLLLLAIAAYLLLSPEMLLRFGIPYDAPYGPPIAKLHPGTYCLLLSWLVAMLSHGNPLAVLARQMRQHRLLAGSFTCMIGVFAWVLLRHGASGAAFIIEALWTPAVVAFVLYLLSPDRHRQLVTMVMLLLLANSLLALGEVIFQVRLTPLRLADEVVFPDEYFRASAFLGHPLHNAMITVSLLPAVSLLPWSPFRRMLLTLALVLSLLAFGGRAALVFGALFYGVYILFSAGLDVIRGRFSYLQLTGGSLALMLGLTGLIGLVAATGLGARIFDNMKLDASASVRLRVWDVFDYLSDVDLWMGIAPAQIDQISLRIGLDPIFEAIENFWIYLFMQFGIVGFVPFVVGLACLLAVLWKSANGPLKLALPVYLLVASTANTLATKTISLMLLTLVIVAGAAFQTPGLKCGDSR